MPIVDMARSEVLPDLIQGQASLIDFKIFEYFEDKG